MPETPSHKICTACNQNKPLSEFHSMPSGKYGRHAECRECKNARNRNYQQSQAGQKTWKAWIKKFRSSPAGKEYRRREHDRYRKTEHGKKALYEGMKRFRKRNPEKIKAVQYLDDRIRAGQIRRDDKCSQCGSRDTKIQAHHHRGYAREFWLDVVWLCIPCHKMAHKNLRERIVTPSP